MTYELTIIWSIPVDIQVHWHVSARAGHNSGHGLIPQSFIMDFSSATKMTLFSRVFDKHRLAGSSCYSAGFPRRSFRGRLCLLFVLISEGRYFVKHAQYDTSDLNNFLVHNENFFDRRLT